LLYFINQSEGIGMSSPSPVAQRPDWVSDTLFPFRSRFLDVDGHVVHYVDEGTGPTLLLLHGNPTWSFVYRDVIARLRGQFRCVALDYPGFGLSTAAHGYGFLPDDHADVVRAFVEQLDLDDVTLVMQDWGGPIGIAAAGHSPHRYQALVVANTWAWPVNGDLHFEFFARAMGGTVGRALIRRFNLFVNAMIPAGHRRRRPSAEEMNHYRAALPAQRRHASAVLPRAIIRSRAFLAEVEGHLEALAELPALVLWADADIAFRDRERRRWEDILANSATVVLPGVGHYLQSDASDHVADAVRDWHQRVFSTSHDAHGRS
jgi:haloalkane dehalogenase